MSIWLLIWFLFCTFLFEVVYLVAWIHKSVTVSRSDSQNVQTRQLLLLWLKSFLNQYTLVHFGTPQFFPLFLILFYWKFSRSSPINSLKLYIKYLRFSKTKKTKKNNYHSELYKLGWTLSWQRENELHEFQFKKSFDWFCILWIKIWLPRELIVMINWKYLVTVYKSGVSTSEGNRMFYIRG